jgi:hypothetical protein
MSARKWLQSAIERSRMSAIPTLAVSKRRRCSRWSWVTSTVARLSLRRSRLTYHPSPANHARTIE